MHQSAVQAGGLASWPMNGLEDAKGVTYDPAMHLESALQFLHVHLSGSCTPGGMSSQLYVHMIPTFLRYCFTQVVGVVLQALS